MVLVGSSLAGAVVTIVLGNWFGTVLLLILGLGGLFSAVLARRPGASDWLRVNAIEYRDERDSQLARQGFAAVGAWALALATLELVAATIFTSAALLPIRSGPPGSFGFEVTGSALVGGVIEVVAAVQLLVLTVVWGIANTRAVKRG